jgi:two-component system, OmpR family, sensor histidine kinase KdpD
MRSSLRGSLPWLLWLGALAAATAAMLAVRPSLDKAHVALVYLLLVLGASARGGRALGLSLSVAAFLAFNFFFVPPYHTLVVAEPFDWLVLAAFLITGLVAAHLLARAQSEAEATRRRASEVDHLSALGAETLNAGRAEHALAAIAEVIRSTLDLSRCEVYLRDKDGGAVTMAAGVGTEPPPVAERPIVADSRLVEWVAETGRAVVQRVDGSTRLGGESSELSTSVAAVDVSGARMLLLPLLVRGHTVGVLRVVHSADIDLDPARRRFLEAITYYAALGADRVRLVADAEHAEALRQADRLKNAVLASVSHDLRTPLTTIKALAHDIRIDGDDRAATIEEEADRLNRMVADLLDLSRLAGGALTLRPELNAAEDLVGAALDRVSGAARERTLNASIDPSEPLLVGRFDFVHALRALVNLIENALKHSPADAPVDVTARRAGEALEFEVADRGPGVPAVERERIFQPFYRPAVTLPDAGGGAGLGLSIARGLAEAQGGSVGYEPREGGGSRFILRLPAADVGALEDARDHQSL